MALDAGKRRPDGGRRARDANRRRAKAGAGRAASMSKRSALYLVASPGARGKVVALRRARPAQKPAPVDAVAPRETSWRDVVRRLTRNPLKA
jgi:hypothetical protein